jgi:hypothetical protein
LLSVQAVFAMPKPFEANYTVAKGSLTLGNLHTSLKVNGNRYAYHKFTKATGLAALLTGIKITENTDGEFSKNTIQPTNYFFNQSRRGSDRIDKIQFFKQVANGSYKEKHYKIPFVNNTQDRASLELSLARDLSINKPILSYSVIERGNKKQYYLQKFGYEKIETPAGNFNAIKVKVNRKDTKRETIFWLAKETDFMPVKIYHREKDDVITTVLKDYKKL